MRLEILVNPQGRYPCIHLKIGVGLYAIDQVGAVLQQCIVHSVVEGKAIPGVGNVIFSHLPGEQSLKIRGSEEHSGDVLQGHIHTVLGGIAGHGLEQVAQSLAHRHAVICLQSVCEDAPVGHHKHWNHGFIDDVVLRCRNLLDVVIGRLLHTIGIGENNQPFCIGGLLLHLVCVRASGVGIQCEPHPRHRLTVLIQLLHCQLRADVGHIHTACKHPVEVLQIEQAEGGQRTILDVQNRTYQLLHRRLDLLPHLLVGILPRHAAPLIDGRYNPLKLPLGGIVPRPKDGGELLQIQEVIGCGHIRTGVLAGPVVPTDVAGQIGQLRLEAVILIVPVQIPCGILVFLSSRVGSPVNLVEQSGENGLALSRRGVVARNWVIARQPGAVEGLPYPRTVPQHGHCHNQPPLGLLCIQLHPHARRAVLEIQLTCLIYLSDKAGIGAGFPVVFHQQQVGSGGSSVLVALEPVVLEQHIPGAEAALRRTCLPQHIVGVGAVVILGQGAYPVRPRDQRLAVDFLPHRILSGGLVVNGCIAVELGGIQVKRSPLQRVAVLVHLDQLIAHRLHQVEGEGEVGVGVSPLQVEHLQLMLGVPRKGILVEHSGVCFTGRLKLGPQRGGDAGFSIGILGTLDGHRTGGKVDAHLHLIVDTAQVCHQHSIDEHPHIVVPGELEYHGLGLGGAHAHHPVRGLLELHLHTQPQIVVDCIVEGVHIRHSQALGGLVPVKDLLRRVEGEELSIGRTAASLHRPAVVYPKYPVLLVKLRKILTAGVVVVAVGVHLKQSGDVLIALLARLGRVRVKEIGQALRGVIGHLHPINIPVLPTTGNI